MMAALVELLRAAAAALRVWAQQQEIRLPLERLRVQRLVTALEDATDAAALRTEAANIAAGTPTVGVADSPDDRRVLLRAEATDAAATAGSDDIDAQVDRFLGLQ